MIRTRQAADGTIRYLVRIGQSPARTFLRKADAEEYEAELGGEKPSPQQGGTGDGETSHHVLPPRPTLARQLQPV